MKQTKGPVDPEMLEVEKLLDRALRLRKIKVLCANLPEGSLRNSIENEVERLTHLTDAIAAEPEIPVQAIPLTRSVPPSRRDTSYSTSSDRSEKYEDHSPGLFRSWTFWLSILAIVIATLRELST